MDPLAQNDVDVSRSTSPAEKLAQALELMAAGIRLKRVALRVARPEASEAELEEAIQLWLSND